MRSATLALSGSLGLQKSIVDCGLAPQPSVHFDGVSLPVPEIAPAIGATGLLALLR